MNEDWTFDRDAPPDDSVTPPEQTGQTIPVDVIFDVLAADSRRIALSHVLNSDDGVTVSELASQIKPVVTGDSDDGSLDQITTRLHHTHVPKLIAADLLTYHDETDRLVPTTRTVQLRPFIEMAKRHENQ